MPSCPCCSRRFRSPAAYELFQRRQNIIADLRAEFGAVTDLMLGSPDLTKSARHRHESAEYRQNGAS